MRVERYGLDSTSKGAIKLKKKELAIVKNVIFFNSAFSNVCSIDPWTVVTVRGRHKF